MVSGLNLRVNGMHILDKAVERTIEYIEKMPKSIRKAYGQFFTSKETAVFMASLFLIPENNSELSILDPGAGSGLLSIAIIDRIQDYPFDLVKVVCYENDPAILDLLKRNLEYAAHHSKIRIEYRIIEDNYILSQELDYNGMLGANPNPPKYDIVIGNPPYKKISKDALEAHAMPDVCYGAPNLYFLFLKMAVFNLKDNCEMVFIVPRSWTSGSYFKRFRTNLFSESVLEQVHLFVSRDKVFDNESVLQETIIVKIRKADRKPHDVIITSTKSNRDFSEISYFSAPYDEVVSGEDCYVFLVTQKEDLSVLHQLGKWKDTLLSIGLRMKTGLTVDYRNRTLLRDQVDEASVPLFYSQHIQSGRVIFPIGKSKEYIETNQLGLLQKNTNYLFVKRFTAKEEHRRLQCGVYLARKLPEYSYISTQNKINFISGIKDLSECVVFGLYVLFNSTVYDRYYRILNGSTQVNSTEINSMPVPPMDVIESMGKELIASRDMSVVCCDSILRRYL